MTAFTKALALFSLLGALISFGLLVATWFAQGLIVSKAREYALESIRIRLEPVVELLENPKLAGKFPPSVEEKLREELAVYRSSPDKWLMKIAQGGGDRAAEFKFPEIKNPLARKGIGALTQRIAKAPEHFQKSYANLIFDLRVFFGTNVCALLLVTWLLFVARTAQMRHWLGAWSIILIISTVFWVYCYLNQSWTLSILFNDYFGWSYALLHAGTAVYLFYRIEPMLEVISPTEAR
jgi:hypothetical protein